MKNQLNSNKKANFRFNIIQIKSLTESWRKKDTEKEQTLDVKRKGFPKSLMHLGVRYSSIEDEEGDKSSYFL